MNDTSKRYRGFTITLNNYSELEYIKILEVAQLHSEKYILGKEVGKEMNTPHIQGYVYFKQPKSIKQVIKLFENSRIHFEGAKGTPEQNYTYCSKDEDYVSHGFKENKKLCIDEFIKYYNEIKKKEVDHSWDPPTEVVGVFGYEDSDDDEATDSVVVYDDSDKMYAKALMHKSILDKWDHICDFS